jgi:hypothetical protein
MKEIQVEHYTNIYPDAHDEMPEDEFLRYRQKAASPNIVAAFPDGSVSMLGVTFSVKRAERWHYALGRAIELAGGWQDSEGK